MQVGNLTGDAISTKTDTSTSPSLASIVMLIENWAGAAVLGTNIKAWVSRDNGSNWYEATAGQSYELKDKGSWGVQKKIITANNIPFAGPTGTEICYKIEWGGQSVGFMETRVHATSLAWK